MIFVALGVGLGLGCRKAAPPPPKLDVLAQWHFAGAEAANATTNGSAFKAILALPETQALVGQTLDKLARAPHARFKDRIAENTNDCAGLLRPLFEDLTRAESCFEMRGASNHPVEWALAVQLPAGRAELWRTNLAAVLSQWTGLTPSNAATGGLAGWRLKKHDAPDWIGFTVAGEWVLFGAGQGGLPLQDELARRIQTQGRPVSPLTNSWVRGMVDWPRIAGQPRWLALLRLPRVDLTVSPRGEDLQTRAELSFPEPLAWNPEPWSFPTNIIRDPVISFTAIQGFGPRLKPLLALLGLTNGPAINQACLWALQEIPYQTFAAVPVPDATNVMDTLRVVLPPLFSTKTEGRALGAWTATTNGHALIWEGMPFFGGFMRPAHEETNGGFIFAGLFPNNPRRVFPPPELFYQVLGRTNLAYYDWEIGAERLAAWRNMSQLALMLSEKPQLPPQSAASRWLDVIKTNLGNIGTSVVVSGPDQMTLTRNSPHGFTGFETVLLANWLESTTFPWGYELPEPPKRVRKTASPVPKP